ncbi:MAG: cupin domain-containing protein [Burkholderiales bacterium]|nr:cupin domain-containing protein [Burkholderiales bacterium]
MNDAVSARRLSPETLTGSPTDNPHQRRALYHCAVNGFSYHPPAVPMRQFLRERDRAFDPATPTGAIVLDISDVLETDYLATTPTLLCRYLKIRAGEQLRKTYVASCEIFYVMTGSGDSRNGDDTVHWVTGDVFCFPGGSETVHTAGSGDALLFCVTNEPLLSFERLQAPAPGTSIVETTHWPAVEIDRHLTEVWKRPLTPDTTGYSVQFATPALVPNTSTTPTINCAINTLGPGLDQRPHRHNGAAITLAIEGEGVFSMIDGERVEWSTGAAQITPATTLHSHHSRGTKRMRSFVIQDEGLHFYTRTVGFSFD